jgi:hypothetical protein
MRKLALLAFVFSANAFACPQLAGNFVCTYQDGTSENVAITQSNKAGVEVYVYNGNEIPADKTTYDIPDDDTLKMGKFVAWCDDDVTLKTNIKGQYYNQGSYVGDVDLNTDFSMAGDGGLTLASSGKLTTPNGDYPINDSVTCTVQAALK